MMRGEGRFIVFFLNILYMKNECMLHYKIDKKNPINLNNI